MLCDLGQVNDLLGVSLQSLLVNTSTVPAPLYRVSNETKSVRPGLCRLLAKSNHFANVASLTWVCQKNKQTAQSTLNIT